jgi:SH3-like domain-containing protein
MNNPNKRDGTMTEKKIAFFSLVVLATISFLFALPRPDAEALCIQSKRANLRQGPGTHFEIKWQVFQYMPFKALRKKGNWYRVQDLDGDIFWVHGKLTTKAYKCAVIKKDKTNLRKGPGTKFAKVDWSPVDKYFSMKVLKIKNNWVKVEDGVGDRAWIYRPLVWIR